MASQNKGAAQRVRSEIPLGVRLGPELRKQVDAICEAEGIPLGRFIRDAVQTGVQNKPGRQVAILARALSGAALQFEHALELGVLKGTEVEERADDVREFFAQFLAVLKKRGATVEDEGSPDDGGALVEDEED